jgi:hypothetical protein
LQDFSQTTVSGDITQLLKTAIGDLYANSYYGTDTIRTLKLPAGEFTVSGVIDLPPMTTLVGDGKGITKLILNSAGTSLFRTVDKLGAHFGELMQFDGRASQGITIRDMTLAYSGNYANNQALLSLDNTINPKVIGVEFTTINTTTGFISSGLGISVQGTIGVDESTIICKDIEILDCEFNVLDIAVKETGAVSRTIIQNNEFSNLNKGIVTSSTSSNIPTDISVSKNKFSFIYNEAIASTTSTNYSRIVSNENQYYYVGNRSSGPDQNTSYTADPIFSFNAPGNVSINDYFNRSDCPYTTSFHYNPIASGNAKIINSRPYTDTIPAGVQNTEVLDIPLTNQDQIVTIEYSISNSEMSRKGRLVLNISFDGYASVSDYHNYSEVALGESAKLVFSTDNTYADTKNYISLTCSNVSTCQTNLEFTYDITV